MTTRHHLTHADQLFWGDAFHPGLWEANKRNGVRVMLPSWKLLGTPVVGDDDSMVDAATSTELPNNATITYTPDTDGTSPTDGAQGTTTVKGVTYWVLDVPRNVSCLTTHATSIVAMTVKVTGLDEYFEPMSETITVAATGTSETDAGLKAFKYIRSIAITSAGNATTNTLNVGFGDVLGLPYRVNSKDHILIFENLVPVATGTFVAAVTTDPATAITGDVRGTIDPTATLNGSIRIAAQFLNLDPSTKKTLLGVTQFAG